MLAATGAPVVQRAARRVAGAVAVGHEDFLRPPFTFVRAASKSRVIMITAVGARPGRRLPAHARSTANDATLRSARLNSTPIRWIGWPR